MLKSKKAKIALVLSLVLAAAGFFGLRFLNKGQDISGNPDDMGDMPLSYFVAKEGSIASSNLFSGTVIAGQEQYVYYDATKGDITALKVKQGDQVAVGQELVQYDVTELQAAYDSAVRARDKVGRQIYDLRTNGQTVELSGDDASDQSAVASTQRSVDLQLQDLNDSYADAQAAVDKAAAALGEATVKSTVAGTVVEVNSAVSKSNTSTNQIVVHIVNQGSLQIKGDLTEYDLANISVDQEVIIRSKVYQDKEWTGKVSYISNYPAGSSEGGSEGATGGGGAKYPFKVDLTSDIDVLKQGFTVGIEAVSDSKHIIIPVSAVMPMGEKNIVWTYTDGKVKQVEVTLGSADATFQEITSGLKVGDQVITMPDARLEDGKEVEAYEETAD